MANQDRKTRAVMCLMRRQNDIMTEGIMTKETGSIMCLLKRHNKKGQRVEWQKKQERRWQKTED